jgi:hypothetical protein
LGAAIGWGTASGAVAGLTGQLVSDALCGRATSLRDALFAGISGAISGGLFGAVGWGVRSAFQKLVNSSWYKTLVEQAARRYAANAGNKAAVSAILDSATGKIYYGASGKPYPSVIDPSLEGLLSSAPGAAHGQPPIHCAECKALNAALLDGANPSNLHVYTLRPRTGSSLPRCPNCQVTVPDDWGISVWSDR